MEILTLLKTRVDFLKSRKLCFEEIRERQLKKFRKFVSTIKLKSPYYRKIIADHGIDPDRCSPVDFPILTKQDVYENFNDIVTDRSITKNKVISFLETSKSPQDLFRKRYYVLYGSGTSGKTSFFVYSKKDLSRALSHILELIPFRLQWRRIRIAYLGGAAGHFAGITTVSMSMRPMAKLFYNTKVFDIPKPVHQITEELNIFQPDIVIGYTTTIKMLAEQQNEWRGNIHPSAIQITGEMLDPDSKKFIKNTFGCRLLNIYASTECMSMGISMPEYGSGMYLLENDLIFEIKKDHTLMTNLFNYTMPLIRYRMEDILIPVADDNAVLPFTKVSEVIGRREYALILMNKYGSNDFIAPDEIFQFFMKDLRRFQIYVVNKSAFIYRIVFKKHASKHRKEKVRRDLVLKIDSILSAKHMDNVSYKIEEWKDLPVDPKSGKFRLIIKNDDGESLANQKALIH
jgi:phenylacetate-coenzyme A ligase PaaK-like adenylate-forming protein